MGVLDRTMARVSGRGSPAADASATPPAGQPAAEGSAGLEFDGVTTSPPQDAGAVAVAELSFQSEKSEPAPPVVAPAATPASPAASTPAPMLTDTLAPSTLMVALALAEAELDAKLRRLNTRMRRSRTVGKPLGVAARKLHSQEDEKLGILLAAFHTGLKAVRECHDLESVDCATNETTNGSK